MPPLSAKNFMLTNAAAGDLGLGDILKQQLATEEEERKKKLLEAAKSGGPMGAAAQSLFAGSPGSGTGQS